MNDLSDAALEEQQSHHRYCCKPIPSLAIYVLVILFFAGIGVSIFILVVVHNAVFLVSLLLLSALVVAFVLWNVHTWRRNGALLLYFLSFPDADLRCACHGQLVKITGLVSCENTSLESSYEKVSRCVYSSTLLYEYGALGLKPADVNRNRSCFHGRLSYSERFSTDFYITDGKSGIRALVKAGPRCKVFPLVAESMLVKTTRRCRALSPHLRKWLRERNLSAEARLLRLEEGYIKEGNSVSVVGVLHRSNDSVMIVQPQDLMSTGCLWRKLLLPVDFDGLILGVPNTTDNVACSNSMQLLEQ